ncbi:translocation/assembly module TamB domain-containing protein [Sphingomonas sp. BN140010]|uniref:Translocation/assembly module TamB domain-containing protein n=1 Tax=Sphingomonas arvum TaxID=2992113 RepID=A0ABT3JI64_9SPHN|nr:translocation/assembly module TamB domain-containing protein [Sphingomonas sp. BN140010]MCW3798750.1 translocation/assembly module TamB domain-containing protein [Sphingomonas sp. BN140010]
MSEAVLDAATPDAGEHKAAIQVRRRSWWQRLLVEFAALLIVIALLLAVGLAFLDSAPGHRWIADRVAGLETKTGLRVRIGRIDGSVFGVARLRNVAVSDTRGVFFTSPEILVEWAPGAWLYNSLHVDRLEASRVTLGRLPVTRPGGGGPLLPRFDVHVGRLRIARLELLRPVTGQPRTGQVDGSATIRAGRAMVALEARLSGGGDRLAVTLDAEPHRDRFDLGVQLEAPADGLVPALLGLKRPLGLRIGGDGRWSQWAGVAEMDIAGREAARLRLTAASGLYRLAGQLTPGPLLTGRLQRLAAPRVAVRGEGRLVEQVLDGRLTFASASLRAVARGAVDLAEGEYRQVSVGIDLLRPQTLFDNMRGRGVRMVWTLNGAFRRATYAYRLTSPELSFDTTGFVDVRAEGRGRLTPWPMRVPLRLSARRIIGVGEDAGAILANARLEGMLTLTPHFVRGDKLRLTSDKLQADLSVLIDLATGRFDLLLSGGLTRYFIPGLGIVDVTSQLHVEPGPGGKGSRVVGSGGAQVRRLDNAFFRSLAGGLPRIEARLGRGPDRILHFVDLQLFSPGLRLSGRGYRRIDGSFVVEASGRQETYGPVRLTLEGPIARPRVELLLARPNESLGLRDVRLSLVPSAAGFDYRAAGQSRLGPFTTRGALLLPPGGRTTVAIAALDVAGSHATGQLRADPGGFTGQLTLGGGGLSGELTFAPQGDDQRIEAHLAANGLRADGPPSLAVAVGRLDGVIVLGDGRTSVGGTVAARGLETAGVSLARLTASAQLVNGSGQVRAALAGRPGSAVEFVTLADITPDRIVARGNGSIEGRPLQLVSPAVITAEAGGWRVAPTALRFAGGTATVGGRTGADPQLTAQLAGMPLGVLDIISPQLDLGGFATGQLTYAWNRGRPTGRVDLRVRNLTRAGLVLASKPIDVGLAAVLNGDQAGARAVAASDGRTISRAQARFAPLGGGPVVAELLNAPLFAQLRYAGPADTLWRLAGTELFDLSGPVAIGADIRGRLLDPQIRGGLRTTGARLESAVTGTVITDLTSIGAFNGSRLLLQQLQGRTPGGGSISGSGTVDLSWGSPALDLRFQAAAARLLARDDIAAEVTGPITIRSVGNGGTISGDLRLDRGRFTLGRASAAASVPRLEVRHVGLEDDEVIEEADLKPWRLDVAVRGGELGVQGLGIDSRWTTDVRVGGTADAPRFTGSASLVRGEYDFAGRSFRLSRGIIRFRGETPPNPQLDIAAEAQVQGLDASVLVRGTGLKPEISFASTPQLPQDELLSRLLFGTSIANLSAPEALQLAAAVAGLREGRSGSLDPINAVRRAAGLDRLRILPADIGTGQKTSISAGKYLTRKLFVEVITDAQGYSATRVEYEMTRWLSLLSSISTIGRTSANVRVSKDY